MTKENLLNNFSNYRNKIIADIYNYVKQHDNRVNLNNCYYYKINLKEFVEKIVLKSLTIEDEDIIVSYLAGEGFEPIEMIPYEDELWVSDSNELFEIINAIKED